MQADQINRIEVDWQALFKPIAGLQSSPESARVINEIVIKPETIPIIFVPGIMGSRLKYTREKAKAWDPDDPGFMLRKYGRFFLTPDERKTSVVGRQSHDSSYLEVDPVSLKIPASGKERGWAGVAWSFYGGILKALSAHQWPEPLNACFNFPVYAFGYNWTDSNRESGEKLAAAIKKIIDDHAMQGKCRQVILVTHSMGGLVARSACKLHGAEGSVLGVVHGTQPATGAPAAYQRMKHGNRDLDGSLWDWLCHPISKIMEKGAERVLGDEGQEVTVLLAHMPGGLELLPNQLYKTNDGNAQWLSYERADGSRIALPRQSDPYAEIYLEKDAPYRLVDPDWLGGKSSSGYEKQVRNAWKSYSHNLNLAKSFHDDLADYIHPESFQFYSTAIKTADKIKIIGHKIPGQHLYYYKTMQGTRYFEFRDSQNNRLDVQNDPFFEDPTSFDQHPRRKELLIVYAYAVEPPSGLGDGTVPDGSGRALNAKPSYYDKGANGTVDIDAQDEQEAARVHDQIFNTSTAQHITLKAIENLCKTKIKNETGA
ncbi:MAG: alpha/beta fold hydrolase [Desulfobacteraceae bacterium]|nr:alpha/beta fold hydrolase [Desulfobacteraceae bacterium]